MQMKASSDGRVTSLESEVVNQTLQITAIRMIWMQFFVAVEFAF